AFELGAEGLDKVLADYIDAVFVVFGDDRGKWVGIVGVEHRGPSWRFARDHRAADLYARLLEGALEDVARQELGAVYRYFQEDAGLGLYPAAYGYGVRALPVGRKRASLGAGYCVVDYLDVRARGEYVDTGLLPGRGRTNP